MRERVPPLVPPVLALGALAGAAGLAGAVGLIPAAGATALGVGCGLALGGLVAKACTDPGANWFGPAVTHIPSADAVALTFDDGPDPESTPALLAALDQAGARATFFVLVDHAERWPELLRAIAERHEVALHGLVHSSRLVWAHPREGAAQLVEACRRLQTLTGAAPSLFRPPFGVTSPRLAQAATAAGLTTVWCSVRTGDGTDARAAVVRERCRRAVAGDIVLLHEGPRVARSLLPTVLQDLALRGLRSVAVGDALVAR